MFKNLQLRTKLLAYGIILSVIPLVLTFSITFYQDFHTGKMVVKETEKMAVSDLEHIVKGACATCTASQEQVENEVNNSLNVARDVLKQQGGTTLSDDTNQKKMMFQLFLIVVVLVSASAIWFFVAKNITSALGKGVILQKLLQMVILRTQLMWTALMKSAVWQCL